jgi:hypothetical protein
MTNDQSNWLTNWFEPKNTGPRWFQSSPLNLWDSCGLVMVPVHQFFVKKPDWTGLLNTNWKPPVRCNQKLLSQHRSLQVGALEVAS